jgi:hypothetical protein
MLFPTWDSKPPFEPPKHAMAQLTKLSMVPVVTGPQHLRLGAGRPPSGASSGDCASRAGSSSKLIDCRCRP